MQPAAAAAAARRTFRSLRLFPGRCDLRFVAACPPSADDLPRDPPPAADDRLPPSDDTLSPLPPSIGNARSGVSRKLVTVKGGPLGMDELGEASTDHVSSCEALPFGNARVPPSHDLLDLLQVENRSAPPRPGISPRKKHVRNYHQLMRSYARWGYVQEVVRLLEEMKTLGCYPDIICYNTVMNQLVLVGRLEDATKVFDDILESGLLPNVTSYNILIRMLAYGKNFPGAYSCIERMKEEGVCPEVSTYTTLIQELCNADRVSEAVGYADLMTERSCPHVDLYKPIVEMFCRQGKIDEALNVMSFMKERGCRPDTWTYNVLINGLCKLGMLDLVEQIVSESKLNSWEPNAVTYNTFMDGLCKAGRPKEAIEKLYAMREQGLSCSSHTLAILINCLCSDLKFSQAKHLLDRSGDLKWYDIAVGYSTVMSRLIDFDRWLDVPKLMADMIVRGIAPDKWSFAIFVHFLCIEKKYKVVDWLLKTQESLADVVAYSTLLHRLLTEGYIHKAQELLADMERKFVPNIVTYAIVVDGFCGLGDFASAIRAFIQSINIGFDQDLCSRLIKKLVRSQRIHQILLLLEKLEKKGVTLDSSLYSSTINHFCRYGYCNGDISLLCNVLDKMLRRSEI